MTGLHPLVRCGLFVASYFLFAQVFGQGPIPAVAATVLMLAVCERRSFDFVGLSLGRSMFQLPGGLLIGCLMVSVLAAALALSGQVKLEAGGFALALWAQWVLIFLAAATGEELLFRGYG